MFVRANFEAKGSDESRNDIGTRVTPGIVVVFVVFPHRKLPHHAAGAGLLFYQVTRHQKKENKAKSCEISHAQQASRTSITANETSLIRLKTFAGSGIM